MMFGTVDVNSDVNWAEWTWEQFQGFYDTSLKGNVTDTPEAIAKVLGVKIPPKKAPVE